MPHNAKPQHFATQGHAEDVIMWHRFNYYVLGCALITDAAYDALEREVMERWPVSCVTHCVGSSNAWDYPGYIQDGRRPLAHERQARDAAITQRWLAAL